MERYQGTYKKDNMKHTPGPWLQETYTVYALQHYGWNKGKETFHNRFSAGLQAPNGVPSAELYANTKLIAAAPDLLEALIDMVSDHKELSEATIENARKAIAKATTF